MALGGPPGGGDLSHIIYLLATSSGRQQSRQRRGRQDGASVDDPCKRPLWLHKGRGRGMEKELGRAGDGRPNERRQN